MRFWFVLNCPNMRFKKRTKKKNARDCLDFFFAAIPTDFIFVLRVNRFRLALFFGMVEPLRTSIREKLRVGEPFWYEQPSGWPCGPDE